MYAIVDIETTGGHATGSGITEVAILLHNGREIEGRYHTLINPGQAIPRYITALTGINNEMVYAAPRFEEVAERIYTLLAGRIFVAHNVNFDFSFLKHHLGLSGYELNSRKLCTVRMSRKIFPGFASYSLGNLCRELQVTINNRHRALGDAMATAEVFDMLLSHDEEGVIGKMLKGRNKEQYLPPHLPAWQVEQLPDGPGVYYFHDNKGKIVYVGKAVSLQQRVKSHFSNNDGGRRKQDMLRTICAVSYKICSSELSALILESVEIRRLWPQYNRSQKKYHHEYGLYTYDDRNGYRRLFIEKKKKQLAAVYTFNLLHEGQVLLKKLIAEYGLSESLCFVNTSVQALPQETPEEYNRKVEYAFLSLQEQLPSFVLKDREEEDCQLILIERGRFVGMGPFHSNISFSSIDSIKEHITLYPDNDYIRGLVYQFAEKYPDRKKMLSS
ncbi:MAG: GIY-YIG nuclease family protein [Bacteroidetes bacterium]|nr:GIY-YIG nuclease family protein [Bacteroidota bacterium]